MGQIWETISWFRGRAEQNDNKKMVLVNMN